MLVTTFFTLMLVKLVTQAKSDQQYHNYCDIPCPDGVHTHTMCEYRQGGPEMCSNFIIGLTDKQKELVLQLHNALRQQVALGLQPGQPSASNMMVLTWDKEGAEIAQRWAEQCNQPSTSNNRPNQDHCRTKLDGVQGGQNLCVDFPEVRHRSIENFLTRRIKQWEYQDEHFQYKWQNRFSFSWDFKSYTQIVWAATTTLGCGLSYNNSETECLYRFVCNYYPAGNIGGEMIYKTGLACSECPAGSGCSKSWPGLCTTVAEDKGGKLPPDALNTESSVDRIHFSLILYTSSLLQLGFYYKKL